MKTKKCHFCKAEREIDKLEKVEVGDKTKLQKYACPECKKNYLDRKEFFSYFHEALDIPKMDRWTVMNINTIAQDYSYEIMLHALKVKENVMIDNFSKGWGYLLAIIKNQLPFSYKEIKKQKEYKKRTEINLDNNISLEKNIEYIKKEVHEDMSGFLD